MVEWVTVIMRWGPPIVAMVLSVYLLTLINKHIKNKRNKNEP
jgi:hypothetical protein